MPANSGGNYNDDSDSSSRSSVSTSGKIQEFEQPVPRLACKNATAAAAATHHYEIAKIIFNHEGMIFNYEDVIFGGYLRNVIAYDEFAKSNNIDSVVYSDRMESLTIKVQ